MAQREAERCMEGLHKYKIDMPPTWYGQGVTGVNEEMTKQKAVDDDINKLQLSVDKLMASPNITEEEKRQLQNTLGFIQALSAKRASCFGVMSKIVTLEDLIGNLSGEFDAKATHLTTPEDVCERHCQQEMSCQELAMAAQGYFNSIRENWKWTQTVMKCADVHLGNAATYHQFFHEEHSIGYWLESAISKVKVNFDPQKLSDGKTALLSIVEDIKNASRVFAEWQTRIENLFDRSLNIVPVPVRVRHICEPRAVIALTEYKTKEIHFMEGDNLTLLDNSDKNKWVVRNMNGLTASVPAVLLLIPPLSDDAVEAAIALRIKLLSLWTSAVKRIGYEMIAFVLLAFQDWNDDQIKQIQNMKQGDKNELLGILKTIENGLSADWSTSISFQNLQEKILRLRMILERDQQGTTSESSLVSTLMVQFPSLEQILFTYQTLWGSWKSFKESIELLKQPKYVTEASKSDTQRLFTSTRFITFLEHQLKPKTKLTIDLPVSVPAPLQSPSPTSEVTLTTERTEVSGAFEMESFDEEIYTFQVTHVRDPRTNRNIPVQQAYEAGLVNQNVSIFTHPETMEKMSIANAIEKGYILYKVIQRRKGKHAEKSYGLIVIKTIKDTMHIAIQSVLDPSTGEQLSHEDAIKRGIIDASGTAYRDKDGSAIPLNTALDRGFVSRVGDNEHEQNEIIKRYVVHGVVDQKARKKVSIKEGLQKGILVNETKEYVNNATGQRYEIEEAIMRGFIKARLFCGEASELEQDPENSLVIQKFEKATKNIMTSLKVVKAFQLGRANGK